MPQHTRLVQSVPSSPKWFSSLWMIPSRLPGLPSFDSSFQLVAASTPVQPRVGLLDGVAGDVERLAPVHRRTCERRPTGRLQNEELVLIPVGEGDFPGDARCDGVLDLLVEAVGEPLQEEDGEDVVLVVGRVDLAAQDVGRLPQLRLQLLCRQRHGFSFMPPSRPSGLSHVRPRPERLYGAAVRTRRPKYTPPPTVRRGCLHWEGRQGSNKSVTYVPGLTVTHVPGCTG